MGFHIDLDELTDSRQAFKSIVDKFTSALQSTESAFQGVTDSGALTGQTGDAVNKTIQNRDMTVVKNVSQEFEQLRIAYDVMIDNFKATVDEEDSTAIFSEDRINEEQRKIDQLTKDKKTVDDGFKTVYNDVRSLISLSMPSSDCDESLESAKETLKNTLTRCQSFATSEVGKLAEARLQGLTLTDNQITMNGMLRQVAYDDPNYIAFVKDDQYRKYVNEVDKGIQKFKDDEIAAQKEAERRAKEAQDEALKKWRRQHPIQAHVQDVCEGAGQLYNDYIVEPVRSLPIPQASKDDMLMKLGFIGGAGKMVGGVLTTGAMVLDSTASHLEAGGALLYKLCGNYDNCPQFLKDGAEVTVSQFEHSLAWTVGVGSDLFGVPGEKKGYMGHLNTLYQNDKKVAGQVINGIGDSFVKAGEDFVNGDSYKIGEHLFDIASLIVPFTPAAKAVATVGTVSGLVRLASFGKLTVPTLGLGTKAMSLAAKPLVAAGREIKAVAKPVITEARKGLQSAKTELHAVKTDVRNVAKESVSRFQEKLQPAYAGMPHGTSAVETAERQSQLFGAQRTVQHVEHGGSSGASGHGGSSHSEKSTVKQNFDKSKHLNNIESFLEGTKSFSDVTKDYARIYANIVLSNNKWSWRQIPGGRNLSPKQQRQIKQVATENNYLPKVKVSKVEELKYGFADFKSVNIVHDTVHLPEALWHVSDAKQFKFLSSQTKIDLTGKTWHHTENPGIVELVDTGLHNITTHNGGRSKNMWAHGKR